jgi:hypothetical protein
MLETVTKAEQTGTAPTPNTISARGIAGRLGVSLRTIRSWDSAGKMPRGTKVVGRKLWLPSEIDVWYWAGCPEC